MPGSADERGPNIDVAHLRLTCSMVEFTGPMVLADGPQILLTGTSFEVELCTVAPGTTAGGRSTQLSLNGRRQAGCFATDPADVRRELLDDTTGRSTRSEPEGTDPIAGRGPSMPARAGPVASLTSTDTATTFGFCP